MSTLQNIKNSLPATCRILAVSKLQSVDKICDLYDQGQRAFAENYVQEALDKQQELQRKGVPIEWHFIGHLQTNKAKQVAGRFACIHSVDSLKIGQALAKFCTPDKPQKVYLQVNLAGEQSKGGFAEAELAQALPTLCALPGLHVAGLMTMPPLSADPEQVRPYFKQLHQLLIQWQKPFPNLQELSMGTSGDYAVAAQEGATWVRLGTVLFGARPSTQQPTAH
jgi:pyridoxal phosphate enzyme (YggS family)